MPDAPVTREMVEAAVAFHRNGGSLTADVRPRVAVAMEILALLAESVLAALDRPADASVVVGEAHAKGYKAASVLLPFVAGWNSSREHFMARIVADEKGGSGG